MLGAEFLGGSNFLRDALTVDIGRIGLRCIQRQKPVLANLHNSFRRREQANDQRLYYGFEFGGRGFDD